MLYCDWSSDVCSSDLIDIYMFPFFFRITWEHINIYDYLWVKLRAKARGFTTHWINLEKPSEPHYSLTVSTVQGKFCVKKSGRETLFFSAPQPGISFSFLIQSHPYKHCKSPGQCSL